MTKSRAALALLGFAMASAVIGAQVSAPRSGRPEATSLFGKPLVPPPVPAETRVKLEADLAMAEAAYRASPGSADALVWVGRRLAYLGRYQEAIETFTKGIAAFPGDPRFFRHRGHRHITVREFDRAIADFQKAAALIAGRPDEVEPDGAPNAAGRPRSTLHSNIWYHFGLAHYLKGEFEQALRCYREGMKVSTVNDDMLVATTDWLYMTLRRLGREAEAATTLEPILPSMDVLENQSYHRRLLMYKGLATPESLLDLAGADAVTVATQGYGVANWYLYNGQRDRARKVFELVLAAPNWAAFGFIAAEADMVRLGSR